MQPICFECVWTDKGTGGDKDGQFYRAHPFPGFVALSDIAVYLPNASKTPGKYFHPDDIDPSFRCVNENLAEETSLGSLIWRDAGSGGTYDGAVWSINGSAGIKVGRGRYDVPQGSFHRFKPLGSEVNIKANIEVSDPGHQDVEEVSDDGNHKWDDSDHETDEEHSNASDKDHNHIGDPWVRLHHHHTREEIEEEIDARLGR